MKTMLLFLASLFCVSSALSMNDIDAKDYIRNYFHGQKNIEYNYRLDDILFIGEGEADFIFSVNRSSPSILVTGSVSHCVTIILYNSDIKYPFAFMAHMNEHNTWLHLKEMFNHAMRDYEEHYTAKLDRGHLQAIVISGDVEPIFTDPKLSQDIYSVLQNDLAISFGNIDTQYFKNGVTSFHDILFDAITHQLDVNHFDIFLSNEEVGYLTKGALEIPLGSAVGVLMQLQQNKMLVADFLFNDTPSPFTAPLDRAQKPACYNCAKIKVKIQQCRACKVIKYCSVTCQKNDWVRHKEECKKLSQ